MASINEETKGHWRVCFTKDGKHVNIRLGRCNKGQAQQAQRFIEKLIAANKLAHAPDGETTEWLRQLGKDIHNRIARQGLTPPRQTDTKITLRQLTDRFNATLNGKPQTAIFYSHTIRNLHEYFKTSTLNDITTQAADEFRTWLDAQGLARATVSRRIIACRTIWKKGQRWKMVTENPFTEVRGGQQVNEARKYFVPAGIAQRIIDCCPDPQWRLIIALSRFGGVRIPSEAVSLRWSDVDWRNRQLKITSPKTEHHSGGGSRLIPLFDELRQPLLDCLAEATGNEDAVKAWGLTAAPNPPLSSPSADHTGSQLNAENPYAAFRSGIEQEVVLTRYQGRSNNWRTQLHRIARRAGVKMWPKAFHNMRASRQSELEKEVGLTAACRYLGNSITVAAQHYLMATNIEEDLRRALAIKTAGTESGTNLAKKAAKYQAAPIGTKPQNAAKTLDNQGFLQLGTDTCTLVHNMGNGPEWIRTIDLVIISDAL